jgi:hypothetical protein
MQNLISNLKDKIPSHFTNTLINVYSSEDLNKSLFSCSNLDEIPTEFLTFGYFVQVDHFENDQAIDWIEFDLNDYVKVAPKKLPSKTLKGAWKYTKVLLNKANEMGFKIESHYEIQLWYVWIDEKHYIEVTQDRCDFYRSRVVNVGVGAPSERFTYLTEKDAEKILKNPKYRWEKADWSKNPYKPTKKEGWLL